jgi:hypothetical protein
MSDRRRAVSEQMPDRVYVYPATVGSNHLPRSWHAYEEDEPDDVPYLRATPEREAAGEMRDMLRIMVDDPTRDDEEDARTLLARLATITREEV